MAYYGCLCNRAGIWNMGTHSDSEEHGILEHILVTPSHHRVHHACNVKYLDKNMGMCLIIWDKIFGTFQKEDPNVPVKYGIYPKMPDNRPDTVLFYEWRKSGKTLSSPD
ncbi:sterol desaturase family protein [Chryseobacterium sp. 1B4]